MLKNVENKTKKWFDERYQLQEVIEKNVTGKLIPRGLSWFGCMGGLALVAFIDPDGYGNFSGILLRSFSR